MNGKSLLLALITLVGSLATHVSAAPVTYWFNGFVESVSNPSNTMPFSVSVGAPFTAGFLFSESQPIDSPQNLEKLTQVKSILSSGG